MPTRVFWSGVLAKIWSIASLSSPTEFGRLGAAVGVAATGDGRAAALCTAFVAALVGYG